MRRHDPTISPPFSGLPFVQATLFVCLIGAGCSDGRSTVTGSVTLDGRPISHGAITFVKQDGALAREGAIITDGAFHAALAPGSYKIELNAQKVVGKRKQKGFDGTEEVLEITEEAIPTRYNTQSELLQEIKPGANNLKLDLKTS